MLGYGGSPDVGRLAAEAAEEVGGSQFFEVRAVPTQACDQLAGSTPV